MRISSIQRNALYAADHKTMQARIASMDTDDIDALKEGFGGDPRKWTPEESHRYMVFERCSNELFESNTSGLTPEREEALSFFKDHPSSLDEYENKIGKLRSQWTEKDYEACSQEMQRDPIYQEEKKEEENRREENIFKMSGMSAQEFDQLPEEQRRKIISDHYDKLDAAEGPAKKESEEGLAKEDRETLVYLQEEKGLSREDAEEQLAVMKKEHITLAEVKAADQQIEADAKAAGPKPEEGKEDRETLAYLQDEKGLSRKEAEEQLAVMKEQHITLAEVKAADQDAMTLQPGDGQAAGPKPAEPEKAKPADAGPATFMEGLGLTADSGREEAPVSTVSKAASKVKSAVSFGSVFCASLADNINNMQNAVEAAENAGLSVESC